MTRIKAIFLVLVVIISVTLVIWTFLWLDYQKGRRARAEVLAAQGKAILYALQGGLRAHCRGEERLGDRADSILSEIAQAAPGVLGLAIFTHDGAVIAQGGEMPDGFPLSAEPQWAAGGFLMSQSCHLFHPGGGFPEGRGLGKGRGRGLSMTGKGNVLPEGAREAAFQGPVWLSVLLDDASYRQGLVQDRRHLGWGLFLSLALVLLTASVFHLLNRHRRLESDLRVARELEKRLKERSELGAGLAHETKNPLTLIRALAQSQMEFVAGKEPNHPAALETIRTLRQIVDEVDQVVGRVNSFLEYARMPAPRLAEMDLRQTVAETIRMFADEAAAKKVILKQSLEPVRVTADLAMVRQVVVNLLANALAACEEGDTIEVGLENTGTAALSVRDTGFGISPEDMPRVREPYFSRREGGTGLGLAIVDQIVQAHGWRLDIASTLGEGTLVCILGIAIAGKEEPTR